MILYVALVKEKSIDRIEFDWTEPLVAIELVRDLIKKNYPPTWDGHVFIDDKPIFEDDSDPMFMAQAVRNQMGAVDFKTSRLSWKYPGTISD